MVELEKNEAFREEFLSLLKNGEGAKIAALLRDMNSADAATILQQIPEEYAQAALNTLTPAHHAEILSELDADFRRRMLQSYPSPFTASLLNELDSDDVADILNELPVPQREDVYSFLDHSLQTQVSELLRYDPTVAGGLMAKELITVRPEWTVVESIVEIRKQAEQVTRFYQAFVIGEEAALLGTVALQDLILSDEKKRVNDIYNRDIIYVYTYTERGQVAEVMRKYDLVSIPVVNKQGQLVGRITIDDVVDVITAQAEEERQLMSGISESVEEDDSVWKNMRARLPWLLIGIGGGLINAKFMGFFEKDLQRFSAMAFFIPLIQATGGNVGVQSSSLVVQRLALDRSLLDSKGQRLLKTIGIAFLHGVLLSMLVFAANWILFGDLIFSMIVSVALFAVIICASLVGTVTPITLYQFGINPALASGPFITTINDLLGLTIYFYTVHLLL